MPKCTPADCHQIKSLASIAHALAKVGEEPVSYKYLEMAAESNEKLSEKFVQESRVGAYSSRLTSQSLKIFIAV